MAKQRRAQRISPRGALTADSTRLSGAIASWESRRVHWWSGTLRYSACRPGDTVMRGRQSYRIPSLEALGAAIESHYRRGFWSRVWHRLFSDIGFKERVYVLAASRGLLAGLVSGQSVTSDAFYTRAIQPFLRQLGGLFSGLLKGVSRLMARARASWYQQSPLEGDQALLKAFGQIGVGHTFAQNKLYFEVYFDALGAALSKIEDVGVWNAALANAKGLVVKAYRRLAHQYHPDRDQGSKWEVATQQFQDLRTVLERFTSELEQLQVPANKGEAVLRDRISMFKVRYQSAFSELQRQTRAWEVIQTEREATDHKILEVRGQMLEEQGKFHKASLDQADRHLAGALAQEEKHLQAYLAKSREWSEEVAAMEREIGGELDRLAANADRMDAELKDIKAFLLQRSFFPPSSQSSGGQGSSVQPASPEDSSSTVPRPLGR